MTAIILMVVGYSMELTKELIRPCLKTILMRVLLQTLMAIGVLWAVHLWIGDNMLLNLAIISYMSAPATFSMQTFLKKEEGSAWYISFWQQWFIRSVKKASGILLSGLVDDKNAGGIF